MKALHSLWTIFALFLFLSATLSAQFEDIAEVLPQSQPVAKSSTSGGNFQAIASSAAYQNNGEIEGVAIQFENDVDTEIEFRFQNEEGDWSEWQAGQVFEEPFSDRAIATIRGEASAQSVKFEFRAVSPSENFSLLNTGVFRKDTEITPKSGALRKPASPSNIEKPIVISREEWNAEPPKTPYDNHPYFIKLTLHHAAGYKADNKTQGIIQVQAIQELHKYGRGWNDIGYHFLVDAAGNIYQGRPETVIGAHVGGENTGNIGVCLLGCFHPPETSYACNDVMTPAARAALIALYGWIAETYDYDPHVLLGHRDYPSASTSCPGNNVHQHLQAIRDDISDYVMRNGLPNILLLQQNTPNPFLPRTTNQTQFVLNLPADGFAELSIYNVLGAKVRTLFAEDRQSAVYTETWDGMNDRGLAVASGAYYYVLKQGNRITRKKLTVLR